MAVQTPVVPPVVPAGNPAYAAVGASDTIPVGSTGKYLLIVKNAGGSADVVVVDDPTSGTGPPGAATPMNPDLSHSVPATTGERHFLLSAERFRDINGNINITHSFQTSVTCIVYGPLNAI
jgi:hypothetical protein